MKDRTLSRKFTGLFLQLEMLHFVGMIQMYINPKHEIRNSKQIQNSNAQMFKASLKSFKKFAYALEAWVLSFEFRLFEFVSDFDIRISNLSFSCCLGVQYL